MLLRNIVMAVEQGRNKKAATVAKAKREALPEAVQVALRKKAAAAQRERRAKAKNKTAKPYTDWLFSGCGSGNHTVARPYEHLYKTSN
jgi:hypothetical protein